MSERSPLPPPVTAADMYLNDIAQSLRALVAILTPAPYERAALDADAELTVLREPVTSEPATKKAKAPKVTRDVLQTAALGAEEVKGE